jgi:hypothetical protein
MSFMVVCLPFSSRPIPFRTERRGICLSYQVTDLDALLGLTQNGIYRF